MSRALKEHDYIGLSEVSSKEQTSEKTKPACRSSNLRETPRKGLNLKATELSLALPGSEFSNGDHHDDVVDDSDDQIGVSYPLGIVKNLVSGAKRGFCDAIDGGSTKAQVVGWPPIHSSRKNSMAANVTKTNDDNNYRAESGCLYVKVSMDGAPYLRKVDIRTYGSYMELSSALEKMFSGFTVGNHGNNSGVQSHDVFSNCRLMNDLHHSEYVLTYKDKDGDWMLVGDVPWNMFTDSCRRLRIMKSSEAVGLARVTPE